MVKYLVIVLGIFFGDMAIKNQAEKKLPEEGERRYLNGFIRFRKHHNRGAFLNAGEKRHAVVAVLSLALTLLTGILFIVSLGHRGNALLRTGLSLLLGGAFSNTYDRIRRKYVVDYLSFGIKWKWLSRIIFNISDFGIMIGALLTALSL